MKDEKETRKNLLECAKTEFMEKGYTKASLRNICKSAGVTTGALYFFFKDKEDLFASLVEEPLSGLYTIMVEHYKMEQGGICHRTPEDIEHGHAASQIIEYAYAHYEAFQLVLTRSQGTVYEQSIDRFVEITEKHYRILADEICQEKGRAPLEEYMIHWIAHMQIDTFVHMLTHVETKEEAKSYMDGTMRYLLGGWNGLFV